jgi:hypothetical protein
MPTTAEPMPRARGAACLGVAVVLLVSAGCSSSGSPSRTSRPAPVITASAPTSTSAATTAAPVTSPVAAPTSAAAGTDLSGRWSGRYSGAFSGTFTLNWQETGSNLHGTITLSNPADTLSLNGSVTGTRIRFGTVGSAAITYSGTVSGHSMSGTYQVNGASGGNWSANTSS